MSQPPPHHDGDASRGRRLAAYARQQVAQAGITSPGHRSVPTAPDSIPGYVLLHEVHRGAQGAVFEAVQSATKRRVAVKIMHDRDRAGPKHDARFEREIEVLAQLRHPNVVAVYDGGRTSSGRLYLVMDFIDGEPVDDFLAERELTVHDTLRLFLKICRAVNAAHVRGVVHRDLKPSNIRVDARGEPHVLDFGLAKVLGDDTNAAPNGLTITGEFVGTLHWASPEQADGDQARIDIRTDVHALGVLLYHALTGDFPYNVVGSMREVCRRIADDEPIRPRQLRKDLDDDVETIVLKCLSKDPERRYQSAGELGRDLERYLDHQPIAAKRDSTWYVLTRTVRRHRLIASLLAFASLGVVGFLVTTTILYRRAAVASADALNQAQRAAEIHREWVSQASFVVENLASALGKLPKSMALRQTLIESTLSAFDKLRQYDEEDPEARDGWARALIAMSKMAIAVGRHDEAHDYRRQALAVRELLFSEFPDHPKYQRSLAINYVLIGDLLHRSDQVAERRGLYERAFALDQDLVARFPNEAGYLDDLVFDHERLGHLFKLEGDLRNAQTHFDEQRLLAERLVEMAPERPASHWALFCSLAQQASMLELRGNERAAVRLRLEMLANAKRLDAMDPDNPDYFNAAVIAAGLAMTDLSALNEDDAIAALHEIEPFIRRFVALEPENHDRRRKLANLLLEFSNCHTGRGEFVEAERFAHEALDALPLPPPHAAPQLEQLQLTLGATENLARAALASGDSQAQATHAERAIAAAKALESMYTSDASGLGSLAEFWANCFVPQICDPQRAEELARRSIALNRGAVPRSHYSLAIVLKRQGRIDEASDAARRALDLLPQDNFVMRGRVERLLESLGYGREP